MLTQKRLRNDDMFENEISNYLLTGHAYKSNKIEGE